MLAIIIVIIIRKYGRRERVFWAEGNAHTKVLRWKGAWCVQGPESRAEGLYAESSQAAFILHNNPISGNYYYPLFLSEDTVAQRG